MKPPGQQPGQDATVAERVASVGKSLGWRSCWVSAANLINTNGTLQFTDTTAPDAPRLLYRARSP